MFLDLFLERWRWTLFHIVLCTELWFSFSHLLWCLVYRTALEEFWMYDSSLGDDVRLTGCENPRTSLVLHNEIAQSIVHSTTVCFWTSHLPDGQSGSNRCMPTVDKKRRNCGVDSHLPPPTAAPTPISFNHTHTHITFRGFYQLPSDEYSAFWEHSTLQ